MEDEQLILIIGKRDVWYTGVAVRFPFQKFASVPRRRLQCDSRRAHRLMVSTL